MTAADAAAMPSLIVETLSADDRDHLRPTMRPPAVWVTVWTIRALEAGPGVDAGTVGP